MSKIKAATLEQRQAMREANYREMVAARLPCLNSNNSIGGLKVSPIVPPRAVARREEKQKEFNEFSTSYRKSAYALEQNVRGFIEHFGIEHVGFLTLTFADHVTDPKEAQRRFNSLRTNYLKKHYPNYIRVIERTKSGRIHYHLIVACKEDIRRGLNFRQIAARNYKSANIHIRRHWESLRENLPKYGFGRAELLPVKTNSKGLARYVAKYIGKHINSRIAEDKGVRLCQTSIDKNGTWKRATSNFQFLSKGSEAWRKKLKAWADKLDEYLRIKLTDRPSVTRPYTPINESNYTEIIKQYMGSKWAFLNREQILNMAL